MSVTEKWLPLNGGFCNYPYDISNLGNVRSRDRIIKHTNRWGTITEYKRKGCLLNACDHQFGYLVVSLCHKGLHVTKLVHKLVMLVWVGECPKGHEVNHRDGDKKNNKLGNLEYVTRRQNLDHAIDLGLLNNKGENNARAVSTEQQIVLAMGLLKKGASIKEAAAVANVSIPSLKHVVYGSTWKHLGLR